ncbi:MAG: hypothetical protein KF863_10840 [Rubrivivax sp.]|nr:hypothetical protein [Rubrivivax sp.]
MSILLGFVAEHRATLAADSRGHAIADGAPMLATKLMPLPVAGCVAAFRGSYGVGLQALFHLLIAGASDFDGLAAAAPHAIMAAQRYFAEPGTRELELVIVGHSPQCCRFIGVVYKTDAAGAVARVELLGAQPGEVGVLHAPWEAAEPPPCLPDSDANLLRLARLQVAAWRAARSLPVGGELVRAELVRVDGRTAVEVRTLGTL